tara:strand:+ start:4552 stop:4926 length:375 start_codon:yes stop_codon:yes gene_type:complete
MATVTITVAEYIEDRSDFDPNDPVIQALITQAECELAEFCSDSLTNKAVALLVMHWATLANNGSQGSGSTGTVKSLKEGDLSISFGSFSNSSHGVDPYLALTPYGLELWSLIRGCTFTTLNRCV